MKGRLGLLDLRERVGLLVQQASPVQRVPVPLERRDHKVQQVLPVPKALPVPLVLKALPARRELLEQRVLQVQMGRMVQTAILAR